MNPEQPRPFGQKPPPRVLRRTNTRVNKFPVDTDFEKEERPLGNAPDSDLSARNHQAQTQSNSTFTLPSTVYELPEWESDAQIAARKAMAKRNSRSFAARTSRTRSRKKEKLGITLDTSFTRHKGNVPRQLYPLENELKGSGTSTKPNWFGLGRSGTRAKGLGITKGTPQPEIRKGEDPKTADSLTPGSRTWLEISPSDRPIPIGISVPSDSVPDFSPYQETRKRSDSDATLVTPSIIITPAAAMKSVWSPDTASDYTPARSSSIYSRTTFNFVPNTSNVPPVPALPSDILKPSVDRPKSEFPLDTTEEYPSHIRKSTLDSAITAFEEDDEIRRKERITSTGTLFEEDETPLCGRGSQPGILSLDTAVTPTPRRSHGWWNVITTPFEFSRTNSTWTQNGRNAERTPDVPMVPQRFDFNPATDMSASARGDSPQVSTSLHTAITSLPESDPSLVAQIPQGPNDKFSPPADDQTIANDGQDRSLDRRGPAVLNEIPQTCETPSTNERNITSPLSAMSASPVLSTAAIGTVLNARQVYDQPRQMNINIELQDRPPTANVQVFSATSPPAVQLLNGSASASRPARGEPPIYAPNTEQKDPPQSLPEFAPPPTSVQNPSQRSQLQFPFKFTPPPTSTQSPSQKSQPHSPPEFAPPPTSAQNISQSVYDQDSRASSPELKGQKPHRKVGKMDWLQLCRRKKQKNNKQENKKRRSRRCCFLLAIIIPVVVSKDPPSQWLNLTGYPPIPTGVSTISQPEAVEEESGCVLGPATVWSCAVPKEEQALISPNKPDQPNFKLDISFENGTVSDPSKTRPSRRAPNAVSVGSFIRSRFLRIRDAPSASPAPPNDNAAPFEGEETPFFITFINPRGAPSRLSKRADNPSNVTAVVNPDGTAGPANLLPLPSAQPLRLYNRGKDNEHYGFYVYYDRAIFLKSIAQNGTKGGNPADVDGGSPFSAAALRCTWSQTRFLVQIWTRSQATKPLLGTSSASGQNTSLKRPGTFPYPVTVTLDRHGGSSSIKTVYCYKMEKDGTIKNDRSQVSFSLENRSFGGTLVNPASGPTTNTTGTIDGGHGGCRCQWQNWLAE
ncbi:uncharacterized protein BDR25DRAFT_335565 [Lindgomyces ingoldianus]|uniref:Uncharacterized protein n=1 Tax=Lindgomyces ingoldianus TaxID=673940 RepID=A0ACB6QNM4_9PLEO|nr:uncharacterized protein BDR25DRAFT_335565 [Lindgomyces ingoldianus]KAF2468173.1 hypothetical protein BDR25DRAFT_335565 [Lindgomyces ingoldianus]